MIVSSMEVLNFGASQPKQVSIEGHRMIKQNKPDILKMHVLPTPA